MVAIVASSTKVNRKRKHKRKGKGKGSDEVNNNNNNENKKTTGCFANERVRKIWLDAKEKGVVFGYPGKRPAHYKDEDNPSWPWVVPQKLRPYNRFYFSKQWVSKQRMKQWGPWTKITRESALKRARERKRLIESGVDVEDVSLKSLTAGWSEERLQRLEGSFQAGDIEFAEIALRTYNEYQHKIKYELAETVGVFKALEPWVGVLHHTNFWARPTAASVAEHQCCQCVDRSPKLFFAELLEAGARGYRVNSCRILDDKSSGPDVVRGVCYICPKEIAHPVDNKLGLWRNQGRKQEAVPEDKAHPAKKVKANPEHLANLKAWFDQKAKAHPAKKAKGQTPT